MTLTLPPALFALGQRARVEGGHSTKGEKEKGENMKRIYPKLGRECRQRQMDCGRHNPAWVAKILYKGKTHICVLGCGDSDDTYFWQDGDMVLALSMNERLGYCGLERFALQGTPNKYTDGRTFEAEEMPGVFFQVDHEIESALGPRGLDLAPRTIRARLEQYCY